MGGKKAMFVIRVTIGEEEDNGAEQYLKEKGTENFKNDTRPGNNTTNFKLVL